MESVERMEQCRWARWSFRVSAVKVFQMTVLEKGTEAGIMGWLQFFRIR